MKKVALLLVVLFMGIQFVGAQVTRYTIDQRLKSFAKFNLTDEQKVQVREAYAGTEPDAEIDDTEYAKLTKEALKKVQNEILDEEQQKLIKNRVK